MGNMPCPLIAADDHPAEDERDDGHQAAEAGDPAALSGPGDVGAAEDGVADDPAMTGVAGGAAGAFAGTCRAGTRSAGRLMTTPFIPRGRIPI